VGGQPVPHQRRLLPAEEPAQPFQGTDAGVGVIGALLVVEGELGAAVGHAHAGVLIILALVGLLDVDQADLGDGLKQLVRWCLAAAPILMPLGFFLSVTSPRAERPNRMIWCTYAGGLLLAVGTVTLGIGLLRA
jgi:hypothetical protein